MTAREIAGLLAIYHSRERGLTLAEIHAIACRPGSHARAAYQVIFHIREKLRLRRCELSRLSGGNYQLLGRNRVAVKDVLQNWYRRYQRGEAALPLYSRAGRKPRGT
jgi:hypothetical protein